MSFLIRRGVLSALSTFTLSKNFQTTLYTGNGGTQNVVSGLDFTTKDGLVVTKGRDVAFSNTVADSVRGVDKSLFSDLTNAESAAGGFVTGFNSDGFTVGSDPIVNLNTKLYVAWQFMKEAGFFDIVSYVGDGVAGRAVAHRLGVTFGMCIIKNRDVSQSWVVQHKDLGGTKSLFLDTNAVADTNIIYWNNVSADANEITLGSTNRNNTLNDNFIAYLFAHNPSKGIFCGSYVGTGAIGNKVVTGFPVGWLLIKRSDSAASWYISDKSRVGNVLNPDTSGVEQVFSFGSFDSDGFTVDSTNTEVNAVSGNYIYVAIADPLLF